MSFFHSQRGYWRNINDNSIKAFCLLLVLAWSLLIEVIKGKITVIFMGRIMTRHNEAIAASER